MISPTLANCETIHTKDGWFDPVPLDGGDVPIFPIETLPTLGRNMVQHVSDFVQCDAALPSACLLGIYALAIQRRVVVSAQSQIEETALWIVPVAGVSERKSSAFKPMLEPVYNFEKAECERILPQILESKAKQDILSERIAVLKKKSGNESDRIDRDQLVEEMIRLVRERDETPIPYMPRLIVDNVTEEIVSCRMQQNEERLALVSAEPTLFDQFYGSNDRRPVLDVFLKAYSGEPLRVDRISRESVLLERPLLTIIAASQPGAVREFMNVKRFNERGILSRFSFVPCKNLAGTRMWNGKDRNPEIFRQYDKHILTLLNTTSDRSLVLSREAQEIYIKHHNQVEMMQADGGEFEQNSWAGKQPGRTLRIAAVLHCAECPDLDIISPEVMHRAVTLSTYFIEAALYIQGANLESEEFKKLRLLLTWLIKQQKMIHTVRDIHRRMQRHFKTAEELRKHLNLISEYGHIRKWEASGKEAYILNPCYQKKSKALTEWQK
jgi:putative DNA primase/helicase